MANRIKGLIVEIGGDTTELGKSLKEVDAKARKLSSELGDVNKLLKFDPGNAELLAQKQKILSEAIANSSKQLENLREAEKKVQEQFDRGEASEEQVRSLRREIVDTENRLKRYAKAAEETENAIKGLGKESNDTSDDVKKTGKESDKTEKELEDLADAADKAKDSSKGLGAALSKAALAGLKAVGAAASAAVTGLVAAAESTREYRTEMGKLDAAYSASGLSAEAGSSAYSALYGIIGETDQSVEAAQQIALLADSEADVARWSEMAAGVVGKFGDALQPETFFESANETLKLGEATGAFTQMLEGCGVSVEEFNAGLAACSSEAERQAYMLGYTERCLGSAGEAYKEANAEIIRANQANDMWMKSLAGIGGAIEPIITDVKMLGASMLSELVPGVQALAEAMRGLLNGDEGAADGVGKALSGIITQVLTKATELAPTLVNVAVSLVTTLTTTLISMIPQFTTTLVQLLMTVIDGLVQAIPQITAAFTAMIPQLVQALVTGIPLLIQGAVQLLMAIVQAIPQIIPPIIAALPSLIMALVDGLLAAVPQLLDGALQLLMAIVQAIPLLIDALVPQIPVIVTKICECLTQNIPVLLQGAIQLLQAIVQAIPLIIPPLMEAIPLIINTLVDFLLNNIDVILDAAIQLLFALIDAIPVIVDALIQHLPQIITTIIQACYKAAPKILAAAVEMFFALIDAAGQLLAQLPTMMYNIVQAIADGLLNGIPAILQGAGEIFSTIWDTLCKLPGKMLSLGGDIIRGLWNGISDMVGWITGKIQSFGESVLGGIKAFFGIKSPSRLMRDEVGKNIGLGVAEGIEESIGAAQQAMDKLGDATINGTALERDLQTRGMQQATVQHTFMTDSMGAKLDQILAAIEKGQVLLLDGKALVGHTASAYDNALGQRRALVARGAL